MYPQALLVTLALRNTTSKPFPMATRRAGGASNSMAAKRIRKEIADLARENMGAITLIPNESNIFQWHATLPGPAGSPYEGGVFDVDINIPDDYPFSPPHLQFKTRVYHCNIAPSGAICLDLLKTAWSPALSLYKVVLSLSSLLTDPNPGDPLVPAIALEYRTNRKKHDRTARDWVKLYAMPKPASAAPDPTPAAPPRLPIVPRPRALPRPGSSRSATPPAPVTGRRSRRGLVTGEVIDLASNDDDDDDDVEILGEGPTASGSGGGSGSVPRQAKRARLSSQADDEGRSRTTANGGTSAEDVIIVDE